MRKKINMFRGENDERDKRGTSVQVRVKLNNVHMIGSKLRLSTFPRIACCNSADTHLAETSLSTPPEVGF
jgi:hypothetical protein